MTPRHEAQHDREQAKRDAVLDAALDAFVQHGFVGASTDLLAARAAVSKQTLYKVFGDKRGVFSALVQRACDAVVDPFAALTSTMESAESGEVAVRSLARQFTQALANPHIQRLRRLVIAEAPRFPELAQMYWESGFGRTIVSLAACLEVLDRRALLTVPDPERAAHHLAGLLLWIPSNRAMFDPAAAVMAGDELDLVVEDGVRVFTRAYAPVD